MLLSILPIFGLAGLSYASTISCGAPLTTGLLYYSTPASPSTSLGQIGILEARGNAEFLSKYPSNSVIAHNISVLPCSSTYLNTSTTSTSIPVKLQLADDPANCLGLINSGCPDDSIIKMACEQGDDGSQVQQFWTKDKKLDYVVPSWEPTLAGRWNLTFNGGNGNEVIANPPACKYPTQQGPKYVLNVA